MLKNKSSLHASTLQLSSSPSYKKELVFLTSLFPSTTPKCFHSPSLKHISGIYNLIGNQLSLTFNNIIQTTAVSRRIPTAPGLDYVITDLNLFQQFHGL